MDNYEGWDLHHRAEVEFDEPQAGQQEKSITLEITPPEAGEAEIWNCDEVTSLQVTVSTITSILKHAHVKFWDIV